MTVLIDTNILLDYLMTYYNKSAFNGQLKEAGQYGQTGSHSHDRPAEGPHLPQNAESTAGSREDFMKQYGKTDTEIAEAKAKYERFLTDDQLAAARDVAARPCAG